MWFFLAHSGLERGRGGVREVNYDADEASTSQSRYVYPVHFLPGKLTFDRYYNESCVHCCLVLAAQFVQVEPYISRFIDYKV